MNVKLTWKEPRLGPVDYRHIAQELRARPGQWARIEKPYSETGSRKFAYKVCTGRSVAFTPAGDFEAVRRFEEGEHFVYVRYLGDGVNDD